MLKVYRITLLMAMLLSGGCATDTSINNADILAVPGCGQTTTDDYFSYITPGWQNFNSTKQRIVLASDPQPFRVFRAVNNREEVVDEARWKSEIGGQSTVAREIVIQRRGYTGAEQSYVPLFVNGDMTEFGHGNERRALQGFLHYLRSDVSGPSGPLMFPGLGNHDYQNNIGKDHCDNNGCPRDAICDHLAWVSALKNKSNNVNFDYQWNANTSTHRGSFSYSVDYGKIHMVQLNNYPSYENYFETGGGFAPGDKVRFDVKSSWDWLDADLKAAKAKGQYTIINMHWYRAEDQGRLRALTENNNVIAFFAGHFHTSLGKVSALGKVPVFQTGAILNESFLTMDINWESKVIDVHGRVATGASTHYYYYIDTLLPVEPEKPREKVTVELYKSADYKDLVCTLNLEVQKAVVFTRDSECGDMLGRNDGSMKVKNFRGDKKDSLVLFMGILSDAFYGDYVGDFSIPNLTRSDLNTLPPSLTRQFNRLAGRITGINLSDRPPSP